ncbi:MAG: TRAP transporter large permease [Desulfopila sp.]
MDPTVVGMLGIAVLFVLIMMEIHIGLCMMMVGFVGTTVLVGPNAGLGVLKTTIFSHTANYGLTVIPLFVLMGNLAFVSGVSSDLFSVANKWLSRLPGGLAITTVGACSGFAAICGSSPAMTATMGKVVMPEMRKYRYDDGLASGSIVAGGTLGILIPPSVPLILYGIITGESIGRLFSAGIVPGILLTVAYMVAILFVVKVNPDRGPKGGHFSWREKIGSLTDLWGMITLFVVVLGGMFSGICTANEAAAFGCMICLVIMVVKRNFTWENIRYALFDTAKTTGMIFLVLIGAYAFGTFLAISQIPMKTAAFVSGLEVSRYVVLALIILIYILLGCLMDALAMVLLTIPIFLPVISQLGFDPIWFAALVVLIMEQGMITPPVGINVFVMAGVAKDIPMQTIFKGIFPFWLAIMTTALLLILFPAIATFLPRLIYGA